MMLTYSMELSTFMCAKWYRLLEKGIEKGYWNVSLFSWLHCYMFMTHELDGTHQIC